jgi:hypothetical protein
MENRNIASGMCQGFCRPNRAVAFYWSWRGGVAGGQVGCQPTEQVKEENQDAGAEQCSGKGGGSIPGGLNDLKGGRFYRSLGVPGFLRTPGGRGWAQFGDEVVLAYGLLRDPYALL